MNPKVSIVIPVYNGSDYLKEAIDSALSQTYKNIEIIVVNDGSNDKGATDKIAKSYGDKIRYFNKKNGGVASALNLGIKEMTGKYFSWLSHDDIYYPQKVEKQVKALKKVKDTETIIFSNVEYIDENSKTIRKTSYELSYTEKQLADGVFVITNSMANGCSLLIPKVCFDKSGLFNDNLRTSNDYEMWFRLFRKYELFFIPDVLIKYRLHKMQGTRTELVYSSESDELWTSIVEKLTKKEILRSNDSLFSFYYEISRKMSYAKLDKAYEVSHKLAEKYYDQCPRMVSVIMPCYNSESHLKEAIDSILDQTFGNFELIVVDDSSRDKTTKIVKEFVKKDYRVKLLENIFDKGISGAMNTGIESSRGKYITRMDSDDISLPDRFEEQVNFLEKNNKYGLCSVNISLFGEQNREVLFSKKEAPLEWLFLWENPIANAPVMYRSSIIKEHKVRFGNYKLAEDYDFLTRILSYTKPYTLDKVLYNYRVHSDSVFHKNVETAIINSLLISDDFASTISNQKTPFFHKYLTTFYNKEVDNIDILSVASWLSGLLNSCREKWGWTKEEYEFAFKDANNRLIDLLSRSLLKNINNRIEAPDDILVRITKKIRKLDTTIVGSKLKSSFPYRVAKKIYREGPSGVVESARNRLKRK